jgi:hypothetical protein
MQLHCGGHLGGRAQLPDTILEEDHPMTIPSKFGCFSISQNELKFELQLHGKE